MNSLKQSLIVVAAHKSAEMPEDDLYLPVHVGRNLSQAQLPYVGDDTGDNISDRNAAYCEMTGLYWAWRNIKASAIGLNHYRRYFRGSLPGPGGKSILSSEEADRILEQYDLVIARPRNYYVETVESHYRNAHVGSDLDVVRQLITREAPDYLPAFETTMKQTKLSLANMFLARWDAFDDYASWLFPILDQLYSTIGSEGRSREDSRYVGFVAERLLNVWVCHNQEKWRVGYLPIVNTEGENKARKAMGLIKRKLRGPRVAEESTR